MKRMKSVCSRVVGLGVLLFVLFFAFSANAQVRFTYSSSVLSASTVVSKVPCLITGASVLTDGTNDVTLILYDNKTTNSGTILYKIIVLGAAKNKDVQFTIPVKALLGVYMSLAGTGANALVYTTPE